MCLFLISTSTVFSLSSSATISMSKFSTPSFKLTVIMFFSIKSFAALMSSSVTFDKTSRPRQESPATVPIAVAASTPFIPLVFGTVTPFTFLIIFPEHITSILVGISPKTSLALAAANAIEIGSVHPNAIINSDFNKSV